MRKLIKGAFILCFFGYVAARSLSNLRRGRNYDEYEKKVKENWAEDGQYMQAYLDRCKDSAHGQYRYNCLDKNEFDSIVGNTDDDNDEYEKQLDELTGHGNDFSSKQKHKNENQNKHQRNKFYQDKPQNRKKYKTGNQYQDGSYVTGKQNDGSYGNGNQNSGNYGNRNQKGQSYAQHSDDWAWQG